MAGLRKVLISLFVCFLVLVTPSMCLDSSVKVTIDPEVHMNVTQLITSKGYPCEEYDVHTDDGYILGIQRIPHGLNDTSDKQRPVVLLQHGLISSSACWVENLANESFAFILADAGFDVWLGNNRGNTYARRHEKLNPNQKEFWDFSWDEMGKLDLPATVDKVLAISKASQLFFVGYSQGAGIAFAQLSNDPDFNNKIKLFAALAPATYLSALKSPLRHLAPLSKEWSVLLNLLGHGEFLPKSDFITWLSSEVCSKGKIPQKVCGNTLFIVAGYDYKNMNESRLPVYAGQNPAGTSVQNIIHFAQTIEDKNFGMFDFGTKVNKQKYNQTTPPQYDVTKVTVPVAMYTGTNDWIVSQNDAKKLSAQIKNLVRNKVIDQWEHLDYIWAMNAPQEVYSDLITLFKSNM